MAQWVECQTANQAAPNQAAPKTVGPKGKGQRLGVVTKRLEACLGFDSQDRSLTGKAGH